MKFQFVAFTLCLPLVSPAHSGHGLADSGLMHSVLDHGVLLAGSAILLLAAVYGRRRLIAVRSTRRN